MNPPDLVAELGERLNLPGLALKDGICRVMFDHAIAIDLEDDGAGNLCYHSVIGQVPHHDRETVFRLLLSTHLFGLQTDGASFGVHPMTDEIFLFRSLPVDGADVEAAYRVLERFTQHVDAWRHRLESAQVNSATIDDVPVASDALRA